TRGRRRRCSSSRSPADRPARPAVHPSAAPGSTLAAMPLRAFPVLYAKDVERVAGFYVALGFVEHARLPGADGGPGFIGLHREAAELAVTTEDSPRMLAGVEPGPGPRHELFVYVED